jgi:hypothetical protein
MGQIYTIFRIDLRIGQLPDALMLMRTNLGVRSRVFRPLVRGAGGALSATFFNGLVAVAIAQAAMKALFALMQRPHIYATIEACLLESGYRALRPAE